MVSPSFTVYTAPNAPHTPLTRKATRLASRPSPTFDMLANSPVNDRTMLSLSSQHQDLPPGDPTMPPLPIAVPSACDTISNVPETSPGRLNLSLQSLESQSHAIRLSIQAKEQGDKETPKTYARQYSAYESWWNASEAAKAAKNRRLVAIPAMPIIPSEVATFLEYVVGRSLFCIRHWSIINFCYKRKPGTNGETIPGSSVRKATISQVISALESYRLNS
ncbi:hypothetical protein B0H13DRAFT_2315402 [Mycena leptocephala]|nr:hypothetical protein B0H13DRAFT_2315402 [Mycena leptocephala]